MTWQPAHPPVQPPAPPTSQRAASASLTACRAGAARGRCRLPSSGARAPCRRSSTVRLCDGRQACARLGRARQLASLTGTAAAGPARQRRLPLLWAWRRAAAALAAGLARQHLGPLLAWCKVAAAAGLHPPAGHGGSRSKRQSSPRRLPCSRHRLTPPASLWPREQQRLRQGRVPAPVMQSRRSTGSSRRRRIGRRPAAAARPRDP